MRNNTSPLLQRMAFPLISYALCAALLVAAMGWATGTIARLERAERNARRQAALEENVRLALWRMDSFLGPVIALEAARPYFDYSAYYAAHQPYGNMFTEADPGEPLVASPLLAGPPPLVRLHFQIKPDGTLESPQLPEARDEAARRRLQADRQFLAQAAQTAYAADAASPDVMTARLASMRTMIDRDTLLAMLPREDQSPPRNIPPLALMNEEVNLKSIVPRGKGEQEYNLRQSQALSSVVQIATNNLNYNLDLAPGPPPSPGIMQPLWIGEELILARRVRVNGGEYIQGCWLDWPAMREQLLGGISDLLPQARLAPSAAQTPGAEERRLASIPASLAPGPQPAIDEAAASPMRLALAAAWAALIAAIAAVGALLAGTLILSQRRGAFVSAVTHELRTPMTTFRLYTDLLAGGMVEDEAKRRTYLETLHGEAERLGRLIENVLVYARLERGRQAARIETVALAELMDRVAGRLVDRAAQGGLDFLLETPPENAVAVQADVSAVEQILMNLVDNACKYAPVPGDAPPNDPRRQLRLRVTADRGNSVSLAVCDHGPGISRAESRRLFRPFHKSAHEAANSSPGVGLGLALSRRLARSMGGDLKYDRDGAKGACFVLRLPAANHCA